MHLRSITKPGTAQSVAPEVKLAFLVDVFEAAIPLFENKEPQNSVPGTGDDDDDGGTDGGTVA